MFNTRSEKVLQAPSILSLIRANCCTTCLSSDRRLYPIKAYLPELRYLCKEVSFLVQDRICYECKAILTKMVKFRERALKAMSVLSSLGQENAMQLYQEININTLSPLTCSNVKNTFDAEYDLTYNDTTDVNISPIEVKIEFDETSIKVANEDTSDGVSDDDDREPLSGPKMEGTVDAESFLTPWRVEAVSAEYTEQEQSDDNEMPPESSSLITTEDSPKSSRKVNNSYIYSNTDQPSSSLPENEYVYDIKIFDKSEMLEYRETMKKSALHVGKSYKCEKCIISISKKELFDKHMELHDMKNGKFMCLYCEQRFPEKRACEAHVHSHFRYYACRYCDYRHHREQQIRWHMQRNHKKFECKKCNDEFPCYNALVNHTRRAHVKKLKCDVCDKTLNSADSLKQHMQRHQGLAPVYECNVCDKKYKNRQGIALHIKTTHNTNADDGRPPAYCVECDKHFPTQSIFKQHLQTSKKHAAPRYQCDHCGAKSINKQALQNHIDSIHMKIPRYECETCDQKFITIVYLRIHKRKVHGGKKAAVKKHVCHVCGKEFTVKKSLEQHLNTHSGLRPFQCNVCGDTFAYSAALYTHNKLKHLKIKPASWKKKKTTN